MAEILRLRDIHKSYNVGTPVATEVLHGIDLVVEEGEFSALIGPSGSGKSTLLNIIGLLERPTAGTLWIGGRDTAALGESELTALRGRTLGFVFQFHHLIPAFDALENTLMPLLIDRGRITPAMRERAAWLLEQVGLGDALAKKPAELSGGMQQRVAIARALAMSPPMVLADEPTGNLDTHTADEIFDLMRRFNAEHRTAFLVVTHDHRLAARCGRRIELVDGRLVTPSDPHNPS
ncbi:MAG: ABC transporter ATP-binding protein [Acetobacteraceae bacterium]|jgi:lipoprotein-releasing system ATP-binding protein|nr:ABC transporter ATP-binding protein [Acetobacteraceae bacterium]